MGDEIERSFGKQVARRAWIAAWTPFESWRTDSALAIVGLAISGYQAWQKYGWPSDLGAVMSYLVTFAAPFVVVWVLLFVWHLWLAPAALAYEAASRRKPSQQTSASFDWRPWKMTDEFSTHEFAKILARELPQAPSFSDNSRGFLRLLIQDIRKRQLTCRGWDDAVRGHEGYLKRDDAIRWAENHRFDVSHVK